MDETDNRELREQVAECHGNTRVLGEKLGITRQAANLRVKKAGLSKFAASLREMHGIRGTRSALTTDDESAKRQAREIRDALKEHGSQSAAARALGMGRTRLQRAMERLGID